MNSYRDGIANDIPDEDTGCVIVVVDGYPICVIVVVDGYPICVDTIVDGDDVLGVANVYCNLCSQYIYLCWSTSICDIIENGECPDEEDGSDDSYILGVDITVFVIGVGVGVGVGIITGIVVG